MRLLWDGKIERLLSRLRDFSAKAGEPLEHDPPSHTRKVLSSNVGYFEKHKNHTDHQPTGAEAGRLARGLRSRG